MLRTRIWFPEGMEGGRKENQQEKDTGKLSGLTTMSYTLFGRGLPGSIQFLTEYLSLFSQSLDLSWPCCLLWSKKMRQKGHCATSEPRLQEALSYSTNWI